MGIKKKLGLGVASAALGLSLVGGGTWAAFNDIETVQNTFAAGTLDLSVSPDVVFNIKDLAPGDWMTRDFSLINDGSIEIKNVLMSTSYTVKDEDGNVVTGPAADAFAEQFEVQFLTNDGSPVRLGGALSGDLNGYDLKELKGVTPDITNAFWLLGILDPNDRKLAVGNTDTMRMQMNFKNLTAKDGNGLYLQNEYQGWKVEPVFTLEAVQRDGQNQPTNNN